MRDKVVIITGSSSGIGRALAFEFGEKGAKIVVASRNMGLLDEVVAGLKQKNIDAIAVQTDVSKEDDCKNLIAKTVAKYGKIDILINNAGISQRALFEDMQLDVMRKVMDINFYGTVYCTKYALPYLLQTKGSVVGVISIAGYMGLPARTAYGASKYAMRGFLNTLRVENMRKGLHVLVVAPGFTESNIRKVALKADGSMQGETPRAEDKMMSSEAVARKIYKGVVRRKRNMILTLIEGKLSVLLSFIAPSLLDKLSYNIMAKEPDSPLK